MTYGLWRSAFTRLAALAMLLVTGLAANVASAAAPSIQAVSGEPFLLLGSYDLAPLGYEKHEFFLSGTATSYKLNGAQAIDGKWAAVPAGSAPYVTRILVVR